MSEKCGLDFFFAEAWKTNLRLITKFHFFEEKQIVCEKIHIEKEQT